MRNFRDQLELPTGNDERIEIRCSSETKRELKRKMTDLDPDLTYEEWVHVVLRAYDRQPRHFERAIAKE